MPTQSPDYSNFSHIDLMHELEALSQSITEVEAFLKNEPECQEFKTRLNYLNASFALCRKELINKTLYGEKFRKLERCSFLQLRDPAHLSKQELIEYEAKLNAAITVVCDTIQEAEEEKRPLLNAVRSTSLRLSCIT